MSNQRDIADSSRSMHWTQDTRETVFCNNNGNQNTKLIDSINLINKVPKPSEYSNSHDQRGKSTTSGQSVLPSSVEKNVGPKSGNSVESNPVGSLQELCMVHNYPFPIYTYTSENLEKPNAKFTVKCFISIYKSSGTGATKQGAKREAAYLMYKKMETFTSKASFCFIDNECEYKNKTSNNSSYLCHESVTILKTFFDVKNTPKTHLLNKQKNSNEFKWTAYDTFKTILEKEHLTFECAIISKKCDEVEVLMQVNTFPVLVISKSGKNEFDARESAALVILTFFKLKCCI